MFEILLYSMALLTNVPVILNNIYVSYQEKTGHMRSFSEAMRPLVPVTAFFLITLSWISLSPSNILERDPRAVFVVISTIFSNICCRLIVAQMSNTRCDIFNWLLVPTSIFILLSILIKNAAFELFLTYTLCIFTTCAHIHYGTCVVRQMCKHLRINCFSIKKSSD
jgi:ethanolaminephosphotransferase